MVSKASEIFVLSLLFFLSLFFLYPKLLSRKWCFPPQDCALGHSYKKWQIIKQLLNSAKMIIRTWWTKNSLSYYSTCCYTARICNLKQPLFWKFYKWVGLSEQLNPILIHKAEIETKLLSSVDMKSFESVLIFSLLDQFSEWIHIVSYFSCRMFELHFCGQKLSWFFFLSAVLGWGVYLQHQSRKAK